MSVTEVPTHWVEKPKVVPEKFFVPWPDSATHNSMLYLKDVTIFCCILNMCKHPKKIWKMQIRGNPSVQVHFSWKASSVLPSSNAFGATKFLFLSANYILHNILVILWGEIETFCTKSIGLTLGNITPHLVKHPIKRPLWPKLAQMDQHQSFFI